MLLKIIKPIAMMLAAFFVATFAIGAERTAKVDRSWATVMKWPDLTAGMWQMSRGGPSPSAGPPQGAPANTGGAAAPPRGAWPLTAAARAKIAASTEAKAQAQGFTPCAPFSPFAMLGAGHPLKFFYTRGEILITSDGDNLAVRRVFMDGGDHDNIDPSYAGRSFGRWDGNTLIIETGDFDELAHLTTGLSATPRTHLTERYKLVDANSLELTAVVSDSDLLTQPREMKYNYRRRADWDLQITTCIGSNREEPGESGELKLNLTPPQ